MIHGGMIIVFSRNVYYKKLEIIKMWTYLLQIFNKIHVNRIQKMKYQSVLFHDPLITEYNEFRQKLLCINASIEITNNRYKTGYLLKLK